jgi:FkbM family methyltransferase
VVNPFHIVRSIVEAPLNRGHGLRAITKFVRWQVSARIDRRARVIPWIDDSSLLIRHGQTTLTGNLYSGLMEYEDMAFVLHALHPDDLFVDVGANMGVYTIIASKVIGADVVSFEPVPSTFRGLQEQIALNGMEGRVIVSNKGVGNEPGTLRFTGGKGAMNQVGAGSVEADSEGQEVEVTTLDSELASDRNLMLKIDVEGFELYVLEGARSVLSSGNAVAILIELNGNGNAYGIADAAVHAELVQHGYAPVSYDPETRRLAALPSFNTHGNTLYVRDLKMVAARCAAAPCRTIHTAFAQQV